MNSHQRWRPYNDDRLISVVKLGVLYMSLFAFSGFLWELSVSAFVVFAAP